MEFVLPVLFGMLFAFIFVCAINSRKKNNTTFDERQLTARGDAFKGGFFTSLIYICISEFACIILDREWITPTCNLALGISLSAMVFAVICILKDAFLSINQNLRSSAIPSIVISLMNIIMGITHLYDDGFKILNEGRLDLNINIVVGTTLLIVTIVLLVHTGVSRKNEDGYEES